MLGHDQSLFAYDGEEMIDEEDPVNGENLAEGDHSVVVSPRELGIIHR
jgi:hypothetical protein